MIGANLDATIDMVAHFAGYLHLTEAFARARLQYDEFHSDRPSFEFFMVSTGRGAPGRPEEIEIGNRKKGDFDGEDAAPIESMWLPLPERFFDMPGIDLRLPRELHRDFTAAGGGGGGYVPDEDGPPMVRITYDESGGYHLVARFDQINVLHDNDVMTVNGDMSVLALNDVDVAAALEDMFAQAEGGVPEFLGEVPAGAMDLPAYVAELQTWLAGEGADPDHAVSVGRYVNGLAEEEEEEEPAPEPEPEDGDEEGPWIPEVEPLAGQTVELGGNSLINEFTVIDYAEATGGMIVLGDAFYTDIIIQMNVLVDEDSASLAGVAGAAFEETGNQADNIALFVHDTETVYGNASIDPIQPVGQAWTVDYVTGDFYNIIYAAQTNWLSDNDTVVQTEMAHYYAITAGGNEQLDASLLYDYAKDYDLVIVGGNLHQLNLISQSNVVLDSDVVKALAEMYGPGFTVTDSGNVLLNEASIVNVGGAGFQPLTDEASEIATTIADQQGAMVYDPELFEDLPGNGSNQLRILYVTGNYYDVTYVDQLNVISDADTAVAVFGALEAGPGANGTDPVQSLSTGGNTATNVATLMDFDSTSDYQLLGGEEYSDTILIQANLVTSDEDEVIYNDPQQLANELVAFTEPTPEDEAAADGASTEHVGGFAQDDIVGGVVA